MAKRNLRTVGLGEDWYGEAQERGRWKAVWSQSLSKHSMHAWAARRAGVDKNVLFEDAVPIVLLRGESQ